MTTYPLAKLLFLIKCLCVCVCVFIFYFFKERCRRDFSSVRSLWKINGGGVQLRAEI